MLIKCTAPKILWLETHIHVVGYLSNPLDNPVHIAGPKPLHTGFCIHHRLECFVKKKIDSFTKMDKNAVLQLMMIPKSVGRGFSHAMGTSSSGQ